MKKEVIAHKNPKSPISEIFRTLRTNIQFMNVDKKMKVLLVTSTFPGEGKSWVASNLAVTFAQAGKKVVIIDSDMRRGRLYAVFGLSPKPGLSNFLSQVELDENGKMSESVSDYVQETEVDNLYVMTSGNVPPNPSELLVSAQMIRLLEELRDLCDIVIIDGTPSELVTDSVILSRLADSTIIVTAHKLTKKDALERVIKNIKNVGGKIAGVIINKVPVSSRKYGERYYYYGEDKKVAKKADKVAKKSMKKSKNKFEESIVLEQKSKEEQKVDEEDIKIIDINADINEEIKKEINTVINEPVIEKEEQPKEQEQLKKQEQVQPIEQEKQEEVTIKKETNTMFDIKPNENVEKETISMEKTNDILKQINDFLDNESKK